MDPLLILVLFVLHMGWGWARGWVQIHHPFLFFCLEFHLPFLLLFSLFFGLSWIRKEAMEIFNNFFTTKNKIWFKKTFGNLVVLILWPIKTIAQTNGNNECFYCNDGHIGP